MKIVLATDGSSHAQAAVDVLKRLPFPPRSELTVLTVVKKVEPVAATGAVVGDESRDARRARCPADRRSRGPVRGRPCGGRIAGT